MKKPSKFTPEEESYVLYHSIEKSVGQLYRYINGLRTSDNKMSLMCFRSRFRILTKIKKHDKPPLWSKEEKEILISMYREHGNKYIADILNARSSRTRDFNDKVINKKLRFMKLKRTKEELQAIHQKHVKDGVYKGLLIGKVTKRRLADESIRIKKMGHAGPTKMIKIGGKWKMLSRHVYEKEHGPIPVDHIIIHKNGNKFDCDIENLACVSKFTNVNYTPKELRKYRRGKKGELFDMNEYRRRLLI